MSRIARRIKRYRKMENKQAVHHSPSELPCGSRIIKGKIFMDKKILMDYIDACELIKETEADIKRLNRKKKTIVQTNVKGSNPDYPYEEKHFRIEGTTFTYNDDSEFRCKEKLLQERKANAEKIKLQAEAVLNAAPMRMQRIIRWKIFEKESWETVADKLGRNATANSVRMELERFLREK